MYTFTYLHPRWNRRRGGRGGAGSSRSSGISAGLGLAGHAVGGAGELEEARLLG